MPLDIIRESWMYWEIIERLVEEKFGKEYAQGFKLGRETERNETVSRFRRIIPALTHMRFPELTSFAKQQIEKLTDPYELECLIIQLIIAHDVVEAREFLLQMSKTNP